MEFGNVERSYVKAEGFDASTGTREGCGENDGISEREGIGGMWLGEIDVEPVVAGKRSWIEPSPVSEEGIAAEGGNGGFEMETPGYGNGNDLVLVRSENRRKLADAFHVAAFTYTDE